MANSTRCRIETAMDAAMPTLRTTNTIPIVKESVAPAPLAKPTVHPLANAKRVSNTEAQAMSVTALTIRSDS